MKNASIGYINLAVTDFTRSLAFYRDVLALPLLFVDDAFQFAAFSAGSVRFAVVGGADSKKMREARGGDFHTGIGFCVPDVDAAHRELAAKGVRFTMNPSKQPWGGYMALFADPDGNIFYLDTPPEPPR
ncbi:MAG TPA: VOC family protein [Candidatus Tumulicola sp.]|nr:VOC family protein [Candidatus Tumulicola sp.]